jgi:hypothetical protein
MNITEVEFDKIKKTNDRILKFFGGIIFIYIIISVLGNR